MTTVVNIYKEPYDVYIGRAGKGKGGYFGNPINLLPGEERGSTIERFKEYFYKRLETDTVFKSKLEELRGKKLGCFCKPRACHGDIIAEYLNKTEL